MPGVWVVVPLFNEAQVIAGVVRGLRTAFDQVVCVDDGSADDSAERARAAGAVVLRHTINLGQGAALQTGLSYARAQPGAEYFVTDDRTVADEIKHAKAVIATALGKIRAAYKDLEAQARPQTPATNNPSANGPVPAYLQAQLANYQAGLSRLTGGY